MRQEQNGKMRKLALSLCVAALGLLTLANVAFAQSGSGMASDRVTVQGTDIVSGGQGVWVARWAQELVDRWERTYGWHVPQTVNIYLYSSGSTMADALASLRGSPLSATDMAEVATRGTFTTPDRRAGGMGGSAILVNLNSGQFGTSMAASNWMNEVKGSIVMELATLMLNDVAGGAGPTWMRLGFINYLAQNEVSWLNATSARRGALMNVMNLATTPGLVALHNNWNASTGTSANTYNASLAISTMTVQYIVQKWGPMALLNVLMQTRAGGNFETIFRNTTGMSIQQMDMIYRSAM